MPAYIAGPANIEFPTVSVPPVFFVIPVCAPPWFVFFLLGPRSHADSSAGILRVPSGFKPPRVCPPFQRPGQIECSVQIFDDLVKALRQVVVRSIQLPGDRAQISPDFQKRIHQIIVVDGTARSPEASESSRRMRETTRKSVDLIGYRGSRVFSGNVL